MNRIFFVAYVAFTIGCKENAPSPTEVEIEKAELSCAHLKVRGLSVGPSAFFQDSTVLRVTIENTCTNCDEKTFNVYESFYVIDKTSSDTLALNDSFSLMPPKNNSTQNYELRTALNTLPQVSNMRFSLYSTCTDIEFEPE